ncbi:uncharacterized protein P174DRAFT_449850 [Aspergillus novofumigatus IBT 16806]|uniref:Uncharacterized protein n=1 Tax=Aspergillus novofumigatus (strain IBT 16806) TaxID=1392255 RepID=A0A2I1CCS3_ASPN1|nr:uncharacterized protein P174DRAFT_449850 [Aspergillus novofumigatus IBT 16806]PKX95433.1 hypothetical protein P174DRAFT_449850 [Aspergillus novofumigatus IBT 16806]
MAQQPSRHTVEWIKQQQAEAGVDVRKARKPRKKIPLWLDDSVRNAPYAFDRIPERVPLPESRDGSSTASDPEERDANAARSSLEAIDRDDTFIHPWSIPLPPSPPAVVLSPPPSAQRPAVKEPKWEKPSPREPYYRVLDRAENIFDHIKHGNIRKIPRLERTSITLYEYYDDNTATRAEIETALEISRFHGMRDGLKGRVFLVEDLSRKTIDALGETFGITPEFFEEHLLNSGYSGARYDDPPARSWKTARLNKPYVSIQWFRPVYRRPPLFSNRDREDLLDLEGDGLEYISGNSSISLIAETNIFRSEWDLRVDPRGTAKEMSEFGLVERTSIWRKQAENMEYETIVVLLDPLPMISISHDLTLLIPKKSMVEPGDGDDQGTGNITGTESPPVLIIEGDDVNEDLAIPIGNPRREEAPRPVLDWLLRRRRPEVDRRKVNVRTSFQVLVKQMAPRKTITIDLEKALLTGDSLSTLQEELNETRSTRQAMHDIAGDNAAPVHVLHILFQIIRQDTTTLLGVLNQILNDMEVDILDDTKMEDRLALWRELISKAERELLELKTSTKSFVAFFGFTFPADTSAATSENKPGIIRNVADLFQEIDQMLTRLRHASTSLTSTMGLLDSRRSIDEAHAVTRLTELAFLFIPLSFSSSIFGMQVEPFKDSAPLSNFFAVAITVTTFAYLMRLTMRSQWLGNLKQSVKQDVRRYAEQHGLPVQVRSLSMLLLLQWFGSTLERSTKATWSWIGRNGRTAGIELWRVVGFPVSFTLLIGAVAVAPVAILWTRDIDRGVQGAVTFVIILALVGLVGVPYWRRSDANFRSAFPRLVMRLLRRIPPTTRSLLLWALGIAGFVAIPLALIWTRPLASGIKAGLTAAILVILLPFVLFLGLRVLFSRARAVSSDTGESLASTSYASYASYASHAMSLSESAVRQPRSSHSQRTNNP